MFCFAEPPKGPVCRVWSQQVLGWEETPPMNKVIISWQMVLLSNGPHGICYAVKSEQKVLPSAHRRVSPVEPFPFLKSSGRAVVSPSTGGACGVREPPGSSARPGPALLQQLLLVVLGARGALPHLLVPLVGQRLHLDAPVVQVFLCESSGEERIQILDIKAHKPFEVLAFYVLGFILLLCEL